MGDPIVYIILGTTPEAFRARLSRGRKALKKAEGLSFCITQNLATYLYVCQVAWGRLRLSFLRRKGARSELVDLLQLEAK